MSYIVKLGLVPLRNEPDERSEMVSQLLFGELVEVLETEEKWLKIANLADGYVGWADRKMLHQLTDLELDIQNKLHPLKVSVPIATVFLPDGSVMRIPMGSVLWVDEDNVCYIAGEIYIFDPIQVSDIIACNSSEVIRLAKLFLNSPYLWGGKSVLGIDCSGLVQTVFNLLEIQLQRDASMQVMQGAAVVSLADSREGDLVFFENNKGKVTHVGILLNTYQIIHASGQVKIEKIDENGIISKYTREYTHKLHAIRRVIN